MNSVRICRVIFLVALSGCSVTSFSQEYFQQEVNYKITVTLNDTLHELDGYEEIEYTNNSPESLEYIWFHLWANAFAGNNTALAQQKLERNGKRKLFAVETQRGYIDSLSFRVNDKAVRCISDNEHGDICRVILNEPLKSGESIIITTPFHIKIPGGSSSKFGHVDQSYRISQWYPKPAVYDRYGWHPMSNLDLGEFYAEYGRFDVEITLPENYVVAATGTLVTDAEVRWLEEKILETEQKSDFSRPARFAVPSSEKMKTICYVQDNIHDFAWFADKTYNVLKSSVELPYSKRRVSAWIFFFDRDYPLWREALQYINRSVYTFSEWFGDYPYGSCTAASGYFSGGGGIEYPSITLMGSSPTALSLERNIAHEIAHNWFYGALGFNERDHPWLDEGISSFADDRYMRSIHPGARLFKYFTENEKNARLLGIYDLQYADLSRMAYLFDARRNLDQPANLHSEEYNESNYLTSVIYKKNSVSLLHLMNYLGEGEFDRIMKGFFDEWMFKHPGPDDFRHYFESHTDKNLSWYFDDLIATTKKLDYAIARINGTELLVKNMGRINAPFSLTGVADDTVLFTGWHEGFKGKRWVDIPASPADHIYIDYDRNTNELYLKNNIIRTDGILKKVEPVKISLCGLADDPVKTDINITPSAGWNMYNGFMAGALFYNSILPAGKFEYQLAPMFGFKSSGLAGVGRLAYHWYPYDAIIQEVTLSLAAMRFAYDDDIGFNRLRTSLDLRLRKKNPRGYVDNYLRAIVISATDLDMLMTGNTAAARQFYTFQYEHKNDRSINNYDFITGLQVSNVFARADMEASFRLDYIYEKGMDIRFFGGIFLHKDQQLSPVYDFTVSGKNGYSDFTYDHLFFGRFESPGSGSFTGNQFVTSEGGFAVYSPFGQTDEWIVSINLTSSLPYPRKELFQLYANAAIVGNAEPVNGYDPGSFFWETGVKLILLKDDIEVYFPLFMSGVFQDYSNDQYNSYLQKIRFVINLKGFNLFRILRNQKNL